MSMDDGFAFELRWAVVGLIDEKFAQQIGLTLEFLGFKIFAQKVGHLVAKDRDTAWFDSDDRRACLNIAPQGGQGLFQRGFRLVEHAEVIERPPAAKTLLRDLYLIARVLQDFNRCFGDIGMEVIAEGIRPEN